jgi:hypothetical protein
MEATNKENTNNSGTPPQGGTDRPKAHRPGWRDKLAIHPAAAVWPLVSLEERQMWAADIKQRGLREKIEIIWTDGVPEIIDGVNRLDALELSGEQIFVSKHSRFQYTEPGKSSPRTSRRHQEAEAADTDPTGLSPDFFQSAPWYADDDPWHYARTKNALRRHLTREQKREVIAGTLKAHPEWSNLRIAKFAKADDKTVDGVRDRLESTSEIPKLEETIGRDGRSRSAHRRSIVAPPKALAPPLAPEDSDDDGERMKAAPLPTTGNDVDPEDSADARKDAYSDAAPESDDEIIRECMKLLAPRLAKLSPEGCERLSSLVYEAGQRR